LNERAHTLKALQVDLQQPQLLVLVAVMVRAMLLQLLQAVWLQSWPQMQQLLLLLLVLMLLVMWRPS
jgi:hypothetical protein